MDRASSEVTGSYSTANRAPWQVAISRLLGLVAIALYNWWVYVAISGKLVTSTSEMFSDLEAAGRPDASVLQHLDLAAGLLTLAALLLRGSWSRSGPRPEWKWLVGYASMGAVGGQFSYACPEGLSAACRSAEWHFRLPPHHYVHVFSGVLEFAFVTVAILLAWRRTREGHDLVAGTMKVLVVALLVAYPLLGVTYLSDHWGIFVEPVFFVCFSAMVAVELFETNRRRSTSDETSSATLTA